MVSTAARFTLEFVLQNISSKPAKLLEVGCGSGAVASQLAAAGHTVVAIDADPDAVDQAREMGVDARLSNWPEFSADPFDAVIFTRSLHHMDDLAASLDRARELLLPGGKLIIEDFDANYASTPTLLWFTSTAALLQACGVEFNAHSDTLKGWPGFNDHPDHDHLLHDAAAIEAAVTTRFELLAMTGCPYFFRYLAEKLSVENRDTIEAFLKHELEMIEAEVIVPLGRRFVARIA